MPKHHRQGSWSYGNPTKIEDFTKSFQQNYSRVKNETRGKAFSGIISNLKKTSSKEDVEEAIRNVIDRMKKETNRLKKTIKLTCVLDSPEAKIREHKIDIKTKVINKLEIALFSLTEMLASFDKRQVTKENIRKIAGTSRKGEIVEPGEIVRVESKTKFVQAAQVRSVDPVDVPYAIPVGNYQKALKGKRTIIKMPVKQAVKLVKIEMQESERKERLRKERIMREFEEYNSRRNIPTSVEIIKRQPPSLQQEINNLFKTNAVIPSLDDLMGEEE